MRITRLGVTVVNAGRRNWTVEDGFDALKLLSGVPAIVDGHMAPPQAPGLGIDVDEAAAAVHPYQPEPQYRWFHEDGSVAEW